LFFESAKPAEHLTISLLRAFPKMLAADVLVTVRP